MNNNIIVNNNFNLLRLIAAFQVMFVHANGYLANKSDLSWCISSILNFSGVTVFFLISGFLISMSYAKNQDLKTYIKNRILRIYPGLYVNIFIGVAILCVFIGLNFDFDFFKWLITQISFLQFYNLDASRYFGTGEINAPLWTISIELVFYAVLPIVFFINIKTKKILPCIFLISILFFIYNSSSDRNLFINKLINVSLAPYLFVFLIGFYFYIYFDLFHKYIKNKFFIYFAAYVIGIICFHYFNNIFLAGGY
ncbi:acyltransferase, partial [uncultured Campylobacter sp.]|uniref:acyltransferase family protein n=1 Tax=uncultured Campylobacter sp. TaxID=218934 RepID=UPI002613D447